MRAMRKIILFLLVIIQFFTFHIVRSADWQILGKMPHPVYGGQALVVDSLIYIIGGYSDSLSGPTNLIQTYDPKNNTWGVAGKMIEKRYSFVATKLRADEILICGGVWQNTPNVSSIEIMNLRSNAVDNARIIDNDLNFNRVYFTGHTYQNRLYLFGGLPSLAVADTAMLVNIARFDLSAESVDLVENGIFTDFPLPYDHTSVLLDSLVYIMGGVYNGVSNRIYTFNLNSNQLRLVGQLQGVRAGGKAVAFENLIYYIGGYDESSKALKSVEKFYTEIDNAETGPALNYNRNELMAVIYDNNIYVFGGKNEENRMIPWIEKLELVTSLSRHDLKTVKEFQLRANYPNPFNATTLIAFDVNYAMELHLNIYSVSGKLVKTLTARHFMPGRYKYFWDGSDNKERPVASGVYFYRLYNTSISETKKMILVR
jgi:N-acetylneuraminic acid mutarotase